MSFITGKHLHRRTFLRGVGVTVALPFLDAMVPAGRVFAKTSATADRTRLICIEEVHGFPGCNNWGATKFLFAPEQTPWLYRVPFSFSALFDVAPDAPDHARFPALARARGAIAELAHGDALYIPPGWWHYVVYDDAGFSLSLRTFPGTPRDVVAALYNILVLRTVDGAMRKLVGQRWNDLNERVAIARTHRRLGLA